MDEEELEEVVTAGQRLKEAREAKGLSVEDIAAQTRIPTRHLLSLEASDWDKLPAATYSVGFAKNYAGAVGLDRGEIGDLLRAEMGGTRPPTANLEVYEAVDPARTMPKGLVISALGLLVLVVLALSWLSNRSMQADEPVAETANAAAPVAAAAPPAAPAAAQAVVLTATDAVWIEVKDGAATLHQGQLAAGQTFAVPASAVAPVLTTGKPEALRITVGSQPAPPVGAPGTTVSRVSLKAADLLRPTAAATPAPVPPPRQAAPAAAPSSTRRTAPVPPPEPRQPEGNSAAPAQATTNSTAAQQ